MCKTFITTSCYLDITYAQKGYLPDLGGYEKDPEIVYSICIIDFPSNVLVRVSGSKTKIKAIEQSTVPNPQTDAQALSIIQSKYPDVDLRGVDIYDNEADSIAVANGINPLDVRKNASLESGVPALQLQEMNLLKAISIKKGVDYLPYMADIKHGKRDAHNNLLDKLRGA